MNKILLLNLFSFFVRMKSRLLFGFFDCLKDSQGTLALLQNLAELQRKSLNDSVVSNVRADDNTICIALLHMSKVCSFLQSSFQSLKSPRMLFGNNNSYVL